MVHPFFISNTFVSNTMLKLAKNQVSVRQHPEAKLLLFENYSYSSSTLSWNYMISHNEIEDEKEK